MIASLLLCVVAVAAPTKTEMAALTQVLASTAARRELIDVVTTEDLRKAADLEADKQLAGCTTDSDSCLAELAAALDAGVVVYGSVSPLGDELVVSLTAFDAAHARAIDRVSKRIDDISRAAPTIERIGGKLLDEALADQQTTASKRLRLLVLDLTVAGAGSSGSADDVAEPGPPLLAAGVVTGGVGVVAIVAGVVVDLWGQQIVNDTSADLGVRASDATRAYDDADRLGAAALALYVVGGVAVVVGGVVAGLGVAQASE